MTSRTQSLQQAYEQRLHDLLPKHHAQLSAELNAELSAEVDRKAEAIRNELMLHVPKPQQHADVDQAVLRREIEKVSGFSLILCDFRLEINDFKDKEVICEV